VSDRHHELAGFIWSVADLLRGDFKAYEYGGVILPLMVLRRLECLLESARSAVPGSRRRSNRLSLIWTSPILVLTEQLQRDTTPDLRTQRNYTGTIRRHGRPAEAAPCSSQAWTQSSFKRTEQRGTRRGACVA